ncbi:MAG: SAM-dependent chlorinase/fluorinase [Planctomycetaceae bacterium]|nr:SAM-dependent chlorinase/fluorinase [Planctomycetales bacterium]MCB9875107.1 SAM-dependent chlorinase/fluorinase [Planctomycetaceae bacterium]MCB9941024.1 SAM-dependent chlorinase/fluorinase [Planctomycetaceae bacterium]HRX79715.1 SAM-dependent chlorinase/fluorinase [Pirellulaceae bacterium]
MPPAIITLTTDFGNTDTYVAQMKGAILSINPAATIVDITHEIPPQDIRRGAVALGEMWESFPTGSIHVAVVDPGVGTSRRIIVAKCDERLFVLPDNGLISRVLEASASSEVVEVQDRTFWRANVSNTFHGRDILAPVAAHLSLGVALSRMGPVATNLALLNSSSPQFGERQLTGEIINIDRFGNLITDIGLEHLRKIPTTEIVVRHRQREVAGVSQTYGQHPGGALIALVGSRGYLELAIVDGHAANEIEASIADAIVLSW